MLIACGSIQIRPYQFFYNKIEKEDIFIYGLQSVIQFINIVCLSSLLCHTCDETMQYILTYHYMFQSFCFQGCVINYNIDDYCFVKYLNDVNILCGEHGVLKYCISLVFHVI